MGHAVIAHQRRPDAEENPEREWNLIAMISIESIRNIVYRDLAPKANIDSTPVREIAHVSHRVNIDREDALAIYRIEHEFVSRFFDVLETRVKRVAPMLVVRLDQEGLRLPIARSVVLAPDKCVRPVSIGTKPVDC